MNPNSSIKTAVHPGGKVMISSITHLGITVSGQKWVFLARQFLSTSIYSSRIKRQDYILTAEVNNGLTTYYTSTQAIVVYLLA